jgi:hypothetical protein
MLGHIGVLFLGRPFLLVGGKISASGEVSGHSFLPLENRREGMAGDRHSRVAGVGLGSVVPFASICNLVHEEML